MDGRTIPRKRHPCICLQSTSSNLTQLSCPFLNSEPQQADSGDAPPGGITDADIDSNWDEAIDSFDGMEIPEELLRGIYAYGFEKPSAIQQRAIKPTMLGRDLIAQAQSGTVRFPIPVFSVENNDQLMLLERWRE